MPLSQHEFYVYYNGDRVMARWGDRPAVVAEQCATPQAAHDAVQSIVNPQGLRHDQVNPRLGFNDPEWQAGLSGRCEAYVRAAYERHEAEDPEQAEG